MLTLSLAIPGNLWGTALAVTLDFQSYGDSSYRTTNFDAVNQDRMVGWWENRMIFKYKQDIENNVLKHLAPEPYLKVLLTLSDKNFFWENNLVFGVGVEVRFLDGIEALDKPHLDWMQRLRLYSEILWISYLNDQAGPEVDDSDFRVGLSFWEEWNIPPNKLTKSVLWGETWFDLSYRTGNFSDTSKQTYFGGLMSRLGLQMNNLFSDAEPELKDGLSLFVLPYVVLDTALTGNDYYWENRINLGAGLRLMPVFSWADSQGADQHKNSIIIRCYVEYLNTLGHWRGNPEPGVPDHDIRVGVNFSFNLY